jgi:hypothetical protein
VDSEGNKLWNKSYKPQAKPDGHLRSAVQTDDGGYALTGIVFNQDDYSTMDLWVLKTDVNGVEQWNRTFNGVKDGPDYGAQILATSDGGFLISGATQAILAPPGEIWYTDYWLIKTDANGIEQWNKTYNREGSDQGSGLITLDDGNYLLSGLSRQTSATNSPFSIWIIKINENGTKIWDHAYDHGSDSLGAWERNLIGTNDGGFLLTCYPFADNYYTGVDYWIIKCNSDGDSEWNTTFGSSRYETPGVCLQSATGEYYVGGSYNSPNSDSEAGDACIVKLNNSGEILWYTTAGEVTVGERILDMVLVEGPNSTEAIVAFGFTRTVTGNTINQDFWLGRFEYKISTTSEEGTTYAGLLIIGLGLGVVVQNKRRRNNK